MTTSQNAHDDAACVRLFAETLESLNEISQGQMMSILDIAIAAADAAKSLEPANADADAFVEKVKEAIEGMRAESAALGDTGGKPASHESPTGKGGTFCAEVEADINVAILQALSSQQQLNVIGASVLAEGAQLVLNAGASQS